MRLGVNMLQFEDVAVIDRNAEYRGVDPEELMENAGKRLAEVIMDKFSEMPVLFVCGTGNNGGDAYVAARYLKEEWDTDIDVYLVKRSEDIRSDIARKNFEGFGGKVLEDLDWSDIDRNTIIVDAMLGTGIKGDIREPYRSAIEDMNELRNPIVSVDVPSGFGSDIMVHPKLTVTFHDIKEGMTMENSGKIEIRDIGIPEKALDHTGPGEMLLYPRAREDSHKGENGRLLIVGGGPYTGAPALAGKAAYRTGIDLVHLAVPSSVSDTISGYSMDFLVHPLEGEILTEEHMGKILSISEECDSVIIGPGLGDDEESLQAVKELIEEIDVPMVVDADALKAFDGEIKSGRDLVLAPHRGEFNQLIGERVEEMEEKADEFAEKNSIVLVVKGETDYITDGEEHRWNDFGNEGMTVGGTGDTLSGVIGALLGKGAEPFNAGRIGAYMTCKAGDKAFEEFKWGLLPQDIIERLPELFSD